MAINVEREIERINKDIDEMEAQGLPQVQVSYFGDRADYQALVLAVIINVQKRGYVCDMDYEDGEIWLTIKKK